MTTTKTERVEIELPRDIIFAMRGLTKTGGSKKEVKNRTGHLFIPGKSYIAWKSNGTNKNEQGQIYRGFKRTRHTCL